MALGGVNRIETYTSVCNLYLLLLFNLIHEVAISVYRERAMIIEKQSIVGKYKTINGRRNQGGKGKVVGGYTTVHIIIMVRYRPCAYIRTSAYCHTYLYVPT